MNERKNDPRQAELDAQAAMPATTKIDPGKVDSDPSLPEVEYRRVPRRNKPSLAVRDLEARIMLSTTWVDPAESAPQAEETTDPVQGFSDNLDTASNGVYDLLGSSDLLSFDSLLGMPQSGSSADDTFIGSSDNGANIDNALDPSVPIDATAIDSVLAPFDPSTQDSEHPTQVADSLLDRLAFAIRGLNEVQSAEFDSSPEPQFSTFEHETDSDSDHNNEAQNVVAASIEDPNVDSTDLDTSHRVVFVDQSVTDSDTLLNGLGLDHASVIYVDSGSDGISQMSQALSQFAAGSISEIHVLSHGGAGTIQLGSTELNSDNLSSYSDMLQSWQRVLTDQADILFYGCDVAKTDSGQLLLTEFSSYTGADVAGSTDLTGNANAGGNWNLEFQTGSIEAALSPQLDILSTYTDILTAGTSGADFLVGTSFTDSHTGLAGNDLLLGGNNLIADAQFTQGTVAPNWSTYNAGSTFGGWTVTQGSVDLLNSASCAIPTGGRSVDLDGAAPGAISQTLATVLGNTYQVRFLMSANATGVATKAIELSVAGETPDFSVTTTSSNSLTNPGWYEQTYSFVATSTSTTLQFRSLSSSGNQGAVIGDIAVADLTANRGDDTLSGGAGDDTIIGSGGNDVIDAGSENDLIIAGGGTNTIDGGTGTDTVVLRGNRSDYSVTRSASVFTITDLRNGSPDGINTISNVEVFRFSDVSLGTSDVALNTPIYENFENGNTSGWTNGAIVSSNTNFGSFLTSATSFNSPTAQATTLGIQNVQNVFKTFSLSGNQTSATIAFTFNRIDSWDSEQFRVWINDTLVSSNAFAQGSAQNYADVTPDLAGGANLGFSNWDEVTYTYVLTVNTTATSLKLGFGSGLNQNWSDEAWGVDNILIREQTTSTTGTYSEGTTGNDSYNGTSTSDSYAGGTGNDSIVGNAGVDYLTGGDGTDSISGGSESDYIFGGFGTDTLMGGTGNDVVDGGAGNDTIYGDGADLIANGSFESGTTSWNSSGKVITGNGNGAVLGSNAAIFGTSNASTNGVLSQSISTVAGTNYSVGFDYGAFSSSGASSQSIRLQVVSGGFTVIDQIITAPCATTTSFNDYEFNFTSLGTSTVVTFSDVSVNSTNTGGVLDNVRFMQDSAGADNLSGGAGNDVIYGGFGNDVIVGGNGADTMFGGGGSDTLSYVGSTAAVTVNLATRTASGGDAASDIFYGFENLTGSNFNDVLTGDASDNIIDGGLGNDTLNGGAGNDTVSYASATAGVTVSLAVTAGQNTGGAGTDTISNFERILGSAFNDALTGDANANILDGGAGNDTLTGGGGNDTLIGGLGTDTAVFSGNFANYTVTQGTDALGSYYQFVDNRNSSPDGTDRTYGIESFQFADRTTSNPLTNNAPVAVGDNAVAIEAGGVSNGTAGSNPTGNLLTNDTDVDVGDTKVVAGVVAGVAASASTGVGLTISGSYGTVVVNSDGSYTYTVNNSNAAVQSLRNSSQTLSDVFTYTMRDSAGATSTALLSVTIQGSNDAPIASVDTITATEAGGLNNANVASTPTGNVLTNDTDVDSGDTKTVVGVASGIASNLSSNVGTTVIGTYGSITIAADGTYSFSLDNSNATVQALRTSADTIVDTYSYTVRDSAGLTSSAQISVVIQGSNDNPNAVGDSAIAVEAGGAANGIAGTNPIGNVLTNDTDVDSGDTKTITGVAAGVVSSATGGAGTPITGTYGSVVINSDGSYTYTVDNNNSAVQALRTTSNTLGEVFTYTMRDSAGATSTAQLTVTIQGTNDAPVAVADTITATESGGVNNATPGTNPSGNVLTNDLDVDSGDTKTVVGVAAGVASSASTNLGSAVTGAYGSITINADGSYTYTVDQNNATVQALRTSSNIINDVFTYTVRDTAGLTSTTQVTVAIQGSNDAPVATVDTAIAVEAGGATNTTPGTNPIGNVLTNDTDVDSGDTKTVTGVAAGVVSSATGSLGVSLAGSYGSLTLNADGSYAYAVDNSNSTVQSLRTSANTLNDVFTYTIRDSAGLSSTSLITITIQGANDAPTANNDATVAIEAGGVANTTGGTNATGNVLLNDTDIDSGDTKTISGVSAGVVASANSNVATSVSGSYGSITIQANGTYTYLVDNTNSNVQGLRNASDTLSDVFTYTMRDAGGLASTAQLTVTIHGSNDTPTAVNDSFIATEAGGISNSISGTNPTGNLLVNDVDVDFGDNKSLLGIAAGVAASASGNVGQAISGAFGLITVAADGSFSYVVDNANTLVQALRTSADLLTDVFTYTIADTAGLTSSAQVSITIRGANDGPTAVADQFDATEASGASNGTVGIDPTGNVLSNDFDPDSGDSKTVIGVSAGVASTPTSNVGATVLGVFGSIVIASDGTFSYSVDNDNATVQALRLTSDTLTDVFTYSMRDSAGAVSATQITVTIHGANDTPISNADQVTAVKGGSLALGTVGINPSGNVLSNDQDVDTGDSITIGGIAVGGATPSSESVGAVVHGLYGSITIASDGSYTYSVDNRNADVRALRTITDTLTDIFTYAAQDSSGATSYSQITITILGANDAPIAAPDTATALEAGGNSNGTPGSNPTGNVLYNDVDDNWGDSKTVFGVQAGTIAEVGVAKESVGVDVQGKFGSLNISSDGWYSYSVDNTNVDVQALLNSKTTLSDIFTYTMEDAGGLLSTTEVTILIQGANDAPIAASDDVSATESGGVNNSTDGLNPTGNVLLNDIDVDANDTKTVIGIASGTTTSATGQLDSPVRGAYGAISLSADGTYTYVVDNDNAAVQSLRNSAQTLMDIFSYTVQDSGGLTSTAQITVTIHGANDTPTAIADSAVATEAGGINNASAGLNPTGNVLINDLDPDQNDTKLVAGVAAGVTSSAAGNVGTSVSGLFGSIAIAADGSYSYIVDNANATVQGLRDPSDTLTDVFTYTVQDADGQSSSTQITITIRGANDTPTAVIDTAIAKEAGGVSNQQAGINPAGNLLSNDLDPDALDTKTVVGVSAGITASASSNVGASIAGQYGIIVVQSDGTYSYTVDNNNSTVQALHTTSNTLSDVFTYTIRDASGASSTAQLSVTIQGSNDAPIASADTIVATEVGGQPNGTIGNDPSGNLLINDTDVDAGDAKTVIGVSAGVVLNANSNVGAGVSGNFGSLNVAADGTYKYTVDNSNPTVQSLRTVNDTISDVFTYTIRDSSGLTSTTQVTVTIQGSDDAPVAVVDHVSATEAGGINNGVVGLNPSGNILSNDTDVDAADTKTVIGVATGNSAPLAGSVGASLTGTYGSITIASDGSFNYLVDNSNAQVQALRTASQTLLDVFSYSIRDTAGLTSTSQITVTIHGSNDNPTATADTAVAVEAGGDLNGIAGINPNGNVLVNDLDPDSTANGETKTVTGVTSGNVSVATGATGTAILGNYGSITIASDGSYSYSLSNSNSAVESLRTSNDTLTDVFSYTMRDSAGATSTSQVTITITGSNDKPYDILSSPLTIAENAALSSVVGTMTGLDVDAGDTLTYSLVNSAGGRFTINANNGVITVADSSRLDFEASQAHTITVRVADAAGAYVDKSFVVNLTDVNEYAISSITDTDAAPAIIAENAANGTVVGITAFASDADATNNTVVYSLDDSASGRFAINAQTGVITVADGSQINYEAASSHAITVRATSADGSTQTRQFTIQLTDVNEFSVTSISDTNSNADFIIENSAIGSVVGVSAFASDADGTDTVTYSLDSDANGRFAIDFQTGAVTVAGAIDREAAASYQITVRATSTDGSTSTRNINIAIGDVDEFDVTNPSDQNSAANAVNENAANGTVVGIVASAIDLDATNNAITYSLSDSAGGRFTIDANSGVVTVANGSLLDREQAAGYNITVLASSSDGSIADTVFAIQLNDVNEYAVSAITDTNAAPAVIAENAANGTVVGITAFASDADATNNTVVYSLDNSASGRFAINAQTGVVTVADGSQLNYEAASSHAITVRATSADGSTQTRQFTIQLTDVNEFSVTSITDTNSNADFIVENSAIGSVVGVSAFASDADGTDTVTYTLDSNANGRFAIDAQTGVVTVAGAIDRETAASYQITVRATSTDGSTSTRNINIAVGDIDEFDVTNPSDQNSSSNAVNENAANGTVVGIVASAIDLDATNNAITYSLSDSAGGRFTIDANSGVVTVANGSLLDREQAAGYNITVRASSSDGSIANTVFAIQLNDVNEYTISSIADTDATPAIIAENAANGTDVGITAFASDADATNNTVVYSLDNSASGRFAINAQTGVVTVADGSQLNYEAASSHAITVRATSADGSTQTRQFTIQLTDVNEFSVTSITDTNSNADFVVENSAIGSVVGVSAFASDADGTDAVAYSLDTDANGRFTIDSQTGVVTVAGAIDREAAASYQITVRATSTDGSTSTRNVNIAVGDIDEFDVTNPSDQNNSSNAVNENAANGAVVGIVASAIDLDATNNAITYSLSDSAGGRFTIDANSGVVTVANGSLLDREQAAGYNITVRASSSDGSIADTVFAIQLNDVNEYAISAIADTDATPAIIAENAANGTDVGITAFASDADATNNSVVYSLDNSASGRFAINAQTGVVTVADGSQLNYESAASHAITVRATSADGSTQTRQFTIQLTDVNEFAVSPINDANTANNSVAENTAIGTLVGVTASAFDGDGTNSGVTYSLDSDASGRFSIDSVTGEVRVAGPLDYETARSHQISVRATSEDGSFSTRTFTIDVVNVNEAPVTGETIANQSAMEDSPFAFTVPLGAITDVDASHVDRLTYSATLETGSALPSWLQFDPLTRTFSGTPRNVDVGVIPLKVTATDLSGESASQSFILVVGNTNDAPIPTLDIASTSEDSPVIIPVLQNDWDVDVGDTLTLTQVRILDGEGSVRIENGAVVYSPNGAYESLAVGESRLVRIEYEVTDSVGATSQAQALVTVHGARDALVITSTDATTNEDASIDWPIRISQVDTRGETNIGIEIAGFHPGTILTDDQGHHLIITAPNQSVSIFGWNTDKLRIQPALNDDRDVNVSIRIKSSLGEAFDQFVWRNIVVNAVADAPELTTKDAVGLQGSSLPLSLSTRLVDTDGSESLTLRILQIPNGLRIFDDKHSFISDASRNSVDISRWDLSKLGIEKIDGRVDTFNLLIESTSTESSSGDSASTYGAIRVEFQAATPFAALATNSVSNSESPSTSTRLATSTSQSIPNEDSKALSDTESNIQEAPGNSIAIAANARQAIDLKQIAPLPVEETMPIGNLEPGRIQIENAPSVDLINWFFDSQSKPEFVGISKTLGNISPKHEMLLENLTIEQIDGFVLKHSVRGVGNNSLVDHEVQDETEARYREFEADKATEQRSYKNFFVMLWGLVRANNSVLAPIDPTTPRSIEPYAKPGKPDSSRNRGNGNDRA